MLEHQPTGWGFLLVDNGDTMKFDIHQYDDLEDELDEQRFGKYSKNVIKLFLGSKEGAALLSTDPDAGHWVRVFMDYGYSYMGVFPTQMTRVEAEEILTELFPRKVAVSSEEETAGVISELQVFWRYMKREHQVPHATAILRFLQKIEPEFHGLMNDSSRFGSGKSVVAMGAEMGFDMTNETDIQKFLLHYNEHIANTSSEPPGIQHMLPPRQSENLKRISRPAGTRNQRKRMRKRKK